MIAVKESLDALIDRLITRILVARMVLLVPIERFRTRSRHSALAERKAHQLRRFNELTPRFSSVCERLERFDEPLFVTDTWGNVVRQLAKRLRISLPPDFLNDPLLRFTMVTNRRGDEYRRELSLVEEHFGPEPARVLLDEDPVGSPPLVGVDPPTSPNTVQHLYHIARFERRVGLDLRETHAIVEWGGGYGNQAKLARRRVGSKLTYVIVDLPLSCALQWIYLASVFGADAIAIKSDPRQSVVAGKINLVPLGLADDLDDVTPDVFISTWALSECPVAAQNYVMEREWFGAQHLLLAYQARSAGFAHAERVGELAAQSGATVEAVGHGRPRWYAFR